MQLDSYSLSSGQASFMIDDRTEVLEHVVASCVPILFGSTDHRFTGLSDWSNVDVLKTGHSLPVGDEKTIKSLVYQL